MQKCAGCGDMFCEDELRQCSSCKSLFCDLCLSGDTCYECLTMPDLDKIPDLESIDDMTQLAGEATVCPPYCWGCGDPIDGEDFQECASCGEKFCGACALIDLKDGMCVTCRYEVSTAGPVENIEDGDDPE